MIQIRANVDSLEKKDLRIGVVVSEFNTEITTALWEGAKKELLDSGISESGIVAVFVPGAIEIPIAIKRLSEYQKFDGFIALGCVIQGETRHFDYVCEQANDGSLKLSLDLDLPISCGILTTENRAQAEGRAGGYKGHKGHEAAQALLETLSVLDQLKKTY